MDDLDLDEKITLLSGENIWHTHAQPKIGLRALTLRDGPHGIRDGTPSFCYPNLNLIACSWDRKLLYKMGEYLGYDAKKHNVDVLLAPGTNIKRNPVCGRNFEYFSEDPYLTGELAAEFIKGLQSTRVAACIKHFCCNNRENGRYSYSANVDERTLREVYLKPFEIAIKKADPQSLMTAYNKVNGEYASQNEQLFGILRKEWNYDGVVMSDWGGTDFRAKSYACGLDLEMPGSDKKTHSEVYRAVMQGSLSEKNIDESIRRIKKLADFCDGEANAPSSIRNKIALAEESMVLLKNEKNLLPLSFKSKIAVVGKFALISFVQGGGCAYVDSTENCTVYDSLKQVFDICDYIDVPCDCLKDYDAVIVLVGTEPDSEGYDRTNIDVDSTLLIECNKYNPNTVCVLINGSVLDLREAERNSGALIETYFSGQVFAKALTNILIGKTNPSGRLVESFITKLSDSPCYGEEQNEEIYYREGSSVGYSYYDAKGITPVFPFGFGLGYSRFEYGNFKISDNSVNSEIKTITVSFTLTNAGNYDGKEVVQIYLRSTGRNGLPTIKLVAFDKVFLCAHESKVVTVEVDTENFTYYDVQSRAFVLPRGQFELCVCRNAREKIYGEYIALGDKSMIDRYTTVGEVIKDKRRAEIVSKYLNKAICGCITDDENYRFKIENGHIVADKFFSKIAEALQLRQTVTMSNNRLSNDELNDIIDMLNNNHK